MNETVLEEDLLENAFESYDFDFDTDYDTYTGTYDEALEIASGSYFDNDSSSAVAGFLAGFAITTIIAVVLFTLFIGIISIVAKWKIYTKAEQPGWASIIPVYSNWILFEMVNMPGWLSLLAFVPVIGSIATIVFAIMAKVRLSKVFGKDPAYSIGLILVPIVFLPILGFGKAEYLGKDVAGERLFQ